MSAAIQILEQPGDTLSPSSCNQYLNCSAKYYYRKVERVPDPPTGALALGSAVHYALGANFAEKIDSHKDLPTADVLGLFHQGWKLKLAGQMPGDRDPLPVQFRDDEIPTELEKMGEALVQKYMAEAAPSIAPAAVEVRVAGHIGGVPVQGYVDLLDITGRIIDIKTAARKPSDIDSGYRFQVATYSQLTPGANGKARVDTLTKTKTPALVQQELSIDQSDLDSTERLYPLVQRSIRAGTWLPNRASFLCSRKYCSAWRRCQADFGGKVSE